MSEAPAKALNADLNVPPLTVPVQLYAKFKHHFPKLIF
jgi:hypothetical protein